MDLTEFTITEASRLIQNREISPVELTLACLDRIEKLDPRLNCFITVTPEQAVKQARAAERKILRSKSRFGGRPTLLGIPLALKDLFETRGLRTTGGSPFFENFIPETDAFVVERLKQAGAVMLGKLNMHEIALGVTNVNPHYGACHNPWDLSRITGGSSGGSAAAVSADLCLGALGTDSGGSIRIPASLCSVVGLKPTHGRISLRGVIPLSWTTDHAGPIAKSVGDAALLLTVLSGYDPLDPASIRMPRRNLMKGIEQGIQGWRIGYAAGEFIDAANAEVRQVIEAASQVLRELGGFVERIEIPDLKNAARANGIVVTSDGAAYHHERLEHHPEGFGDDVRQRLQGGAAVTSTEYALARRAQAVYRRQFEQVFAAFDLIIMPTTPVAAPLIEGPDAIEQARLLTRYTAPFNLTGLPALSIPAGFTRQGLPVGMQLVARPWAEASLLRAAYAFEKATQWHLRKPELEKI